MPEPDAGRAVSDDIDNDIESGSGARDADPIPREVSPDDRGLPDFVALIQTQLAQAAAAEEGRSRVTPSPLGAGEVVLTARELAGLSQRSLAARLGSSQPSIASIESGHRMPMVRTLMRVAQAAGFQLVIGLSRPGADAPVALGALIPNIDDGLADYLPLTTPSPFAGP